MTGLSISECCARIHAPVGLDLGGDGPEAMAMAVIAEAQACCFGRLGRADSRLPMFLFKSSRGPPCTPGARCALELSADWDNFRRAIIPAAEAQLPKSNSFA